MTIGRPHSSWAISFAELLFRVLRSDRPEVLPPGGDVISSSDCWLVRRGHADDIDSDLADTCYELILGMMIPQKNSREYNEYAQINIAMGLN